ncbi:MULTISPECIES: glycoside hydrolase domain-containing protein [unclassified Streptomyces]|uniref:glycoside hydrolase domain-containing protein n=2 Tax=Streptomyces TaxID=1883 RepID=UPI001F42D975|nr:MULTISPECIES: glycoside hydrolase domain-containing protein [unclassified Streptomyces]MCF0087236.1 hypothetical protein [Streptomyces sp. MH192]MCF0100631.1 hypothetical protein [Streptomyces sp. MH191]
MDEKVLAAQKWVNATYGGVSGYNRCPENGATGWATMFSLTRGLQVELGITALSDSFGPTTLSKLAALGDIGPSTSNENIIRIVQSALFCKGYWGGNEDGTYDAATMASVTQLKRNAGFAVPSDGRVQPKIFKALLTMDAYSLLSGGTEEVRTIQQWLNSSYLNKSTFFLIPCDGHYTRDVQTALMKALQYEFGVPEDQATGNFGPTTQAGLRNHQVAEGDSGIFVKLFSAACVFNGRVGSTSTVFKTAFDSALTTYVRAFQEFSALTVNGRGDYQTWAQLLVSMGDPDRDAGACDTRFHISVDRARALVSGGYTVVGRYLDEDPDSTLDKEIQPGELDAIFDGGMRVFPISQYGARSLSDFTFPQGYAHAQKAHDRAVGYGFNTGTVIYFAVDYDATDPEITSNIVPYFNGVQSGLASRGKRYVAGVYGSRNVCSRVSAEAYARYSFVSGMSWGFSGNLGFPMPENWSFTQIKEFRFSASQTDSFDLDRDVQRPHADKGVGRDGIGGTESPVSKYVQYIADLYSTAVRYDKGNPSLRVMEYLRYPRYVDLYSGWQTLIGDVDRDWIAYAEDNGPNRVTSFTDPSYGVTVHADHFGATVNAFYLKGSGSGTGANRGDFGGWGGDLSTFYGDWRNNADSYASGYAFCMDRLAKLNVSSSFSFGDMVEDVDGYLVGTAVKNGARIDEQVQSLIGGNGHLRRFTNYFAQRHGSSVSHAEDTARTMLVDVGDDDVLDAMRTQAIRQVSGWNTLLPGYLTDGKLDPYLQGYAETLQKLADQEG